MALSVLVVTPSPGFGELISQILQEAGGYECTLATDGKRALQAAQAHSPVLCVLDGDLDEPPLDKFVKELRGVCPQVRLVVIPPDDEDKVVDFSKLQVDAVVAKPFYLPDLISKVEDLFKQGPPVAKAEGNAAPVAFTEDDAPTPLWLQDVNLAAQHLTRLSLESASQASLIVKGNQVWAYAGELPQGAVEELARTLGQHWAGGNGSDLARFVRLEATGSDYMLYATDLGGGFVLAMVFDTETPFSKIRSQAGNLAERLSSLPESVPTEPLTLAPDTEPLILQPLLEDVPPPIPNDWIPEHPLEGGRKPFMEELLHDAAPTDSFSKETNPAVRRPFEGPATVDVAFEEALAETMPSMSQDAETVASAVEQGFEATVPSRSTELESGPIRLQSISPALVNLTYSCVLIPRLPDHFLTGDLAGKLSEWLTQLSLAFGWRLEQLSVRPDYLQWMVNVQPQTSPAYLMRIIRQHTSRRLFVEFPRFVETNPSGDFWAPGYFIISGPQPPQAQLVKDFIKETRIRQGIIKK